MWVEYGQECGFQIKGVSNARSDVIGLKIWNWAAVNFFPRSAPENDVCFDNDFIYWFVRDIDMKIDIQIKTFHIVIVETEDIFLWRERIFESGQN